MHTNGNTAAPLHLLLLEDNPADAELIKAELRRGGVHADFEVVANRAQYVASLDHVPDLILSDYHLPQFNAGEALELLQDRHLDIPFIIVSGAIGEETAVELMKLGATDCISKECLGRVTESLARAVKATGLRRERKVNEKALRDSEARMRSTIDSALDCIVTIDQQSLILDFNPAAERTFGYKREGAIGRLLSEMIIPPRLRESHLRGMAKLLQTGESRILRQRIEVMGMREDGSEFPLEVTVNRLGTQEPALFTVFMRDITERTAAREKLRQQEEQYRQLFEKNPVPTWVYDPDTLAYLAANEAAIRHYGYSRDEFLAMTLKDARPVEDVPRLLTMLASRGSVGFSIWRHLKKDGTLIDVQVTTQPIRFQGRPAGLVMAEDITERQLAEATLRTSEANLENAQRIAHLGSWQWDIATGKLDWSAEIYRIFGFTTGNFEPSYEMFSNAVHPLDRRAVQSAVDFALCGRGPYSIDHRVVRPDGTERIVHEEGEVTLDETGKAKCMTGTVHDITRRKQIEAELRESDGRSREQAALLDLAHDAIMVRSMDDRVLYWNHGAEKLYGWTAIEAIGKPASTFLYREEAATIAAAQTILLERGQWTGECKHLRRDGGGITVRSRWTLVRDEEGKPKAVLIINTDVTEQKKVEEQFLRAQRLESIGTLASGVAHDLNNILSPILMSAPLLHGELSLDIKENIISTIEQSAERGAQIVRQVLTFARGLEGERVLLDPSHLLKEMANIAEQTFPKSIRVTARYPEDRWLVEGDPTQLHQILLNLSVNARDAMPAGGTFLLAMENFEVDEHYASMMPGAKPGMYVLLIATDSGIGMRREVIDKIFDPFFTTKEVGVGTGLGLSTVLGIVKSHGGFLAVESEIGNGTTFKIFLPASTGGALSTEALEALPEGNGETILVVDDEPSIVAVTKLILENYHYRVLTAEDGPEALAIFAQQMERIDVVMTDLLMPFMDGVALVRSMKKMKPGIRVIASTGQDEQARFSELQSLGVTTCLPKPYNQGKLLETVRAVLEAKPDYVGSLS